MIFNKNAIYKYINSQKYVQYVLNCFKRIDVNQFVFVKSVVIRVRFFCMQENFSEKDKKK